MNKINIKGPFISLYTRYGVEGYDEHETKKDAIRKLAYGSDEGLIMDIAVIEVATKKMVWYKDFLGKEICQDRVNKFVSKHL